VPGQKVIFTKTSLQDMHVQTTPHNPASFSLDVPSGESASLSLNTPGLYHYFDAASSHVIDYQGNTDVVHTLAGAPNADLPNQGWIVVPGRGGIPFDQSIHVPSQHDLLTPRAAVVRVGGSVLMHNHDTDAHNLVTDPADPSGAAFELLGTDGEPAIGGAERQITFTKTGLYHLYCSIHARIVGQVGRWQVVVPRDDSATGFPDGDPMESWILVAP
jgi:plastocyanin